MKKIILVLIGALCSAGCSNNFNNASGKTRSAEVQKDIIEITCTPKKYGTAEYLVINTKENTVIDNSVNQKNVLIDKNRIYFQSFDEASKTTFTVKIDRSTGNMYVFDDKNAASRLDYHCQKIDPKF